MGDYVDAQDSTRKWYEAIVREVSPTTVKVHYFGWGSKWDAVLPRSSKNSNKGATNSKSLAPPAPLWSKTVKWREQIKVGDEVEIRESTSLVQRPKWHRATVLAVGNEHDTPRELEGGAELELFVVNTVSGSGGSGSGHVSHKRRRKVPLLLLNRKRQVCVMYSIVLFFCIPSFCCEISHKSCSFTPYCCPHHVLQPHTKRFWSKFHRKYTIAPRPHH